MFISAPFHTHMLLIFFTTILWVLAKVEAQGNVSVGDSLSANDKNGAWQSPSGDFAFGFHSISGEKDKFLLAIWYAKIPERTIVWYAKIPERTIVWFADNPAIDRESKVELLPTGRLVLTDPTGKELWRSPGITGDAPVSHAAMLDTGNFVIVSRNSTNIWESFKYPTDTVLPGQELGVDGYLLSTLSETSSGKGKYQLRFSDGSFVLNQLDVFTRKPYEDYAVLGNGSRFVFNKSGHIQISNSNGSLVEVAPVNAVPKPELYYYRATLDFYGVFTLYYYPRNPGGGGGSWSALWFTPRNICRRFVERRTNSGRDTFGTNPCGYNSICEPINANGRPNCTCPPGFSFLDDSNQYAGCKQDYANYPADCNPDGSTIGEDRFEFKSMSFADFPFGDYGVLQPATELECRQSCLLDCSCAVAILQDPTLSEDGSGTCWKKKLPLSNGLFDRDRVDRTALFKVLKSDASRTKPARPNQRDENRNQIILILGVLLGTSAFFNFFSLAAIALIFFCLFRRRLHDLTGVRSRRNLETNVQFFEYKDLEHATNGFKEELGRGAFGTVYKGELPFGYGDRVAVKKLENFAQDSEREFKTEVKVIGQTHHKNLVRLVGYCDEGEHRLLVYEFMENGSLSSFLFGVLRPSWQQRLQIASGIAKGLTYLHEECSKQIIHCDIKPQNILLDESLTAKISDFGLAKLLMNNKTQTQTGIRGTKGYVAPEWFRNTPVSVKVDVYSFGVVLLEIICCRRCVEVEMEEAAILTEWAFQCYSAGMIEKLVENDEEATVDVAKLEMLLKVAIWCVQEEPMLRPSMKTVTMMLEGAVQVPNPPCPFLLETVSMSTTLI
ncbi:Brassinosteroid insensitive 1-associated receptor kinase 1 precursor [Hibiscus syriacus]|uniref:Receptor-like serine/threonine-protein kinase n=1 Tax=Hibiscus syriacus TaxID=106335 RepID=A0A6A2YHP2_HIBSY|nr:G-type lectin S-receptor-like serine/threonine-protein kinase LECRK4 [Hibiscus syriacus]KAE8675487.1 Brassinosteroid insensitive 1-associated receptor kinase 1 precursor [Hibiscus syriacus]